MTYEQLLAESKQLSAENEQLRTENAALKRQVAELEQQVEALEAALKEALAQLETARRAGKRQAAPFSRGQPQADPKPPGRKPGHPPAHRPKPHRVDRVIEVKLNRTTCLVCGGELVDHTIHVQYQVEIPPVQPVVTQFPGQDRQHRSSSLRRVWPTGTGPPPGADLGCTGCSGGAACPGQGSAPAPWVWPQR